MQPSEAICEVRRRDDEWCGWCPECREWKILHGELRDFGVCGECRESLIDSTWDRTDALLEYIIDEAKSIRADMARVMGVPRK